MTTATEEMTEVTLEQAMHAGALMCERETPLRAVAATMARCHIHAVIVFYEGNEPDEDSGPWGIVSDRDVIAAVADGCIDDVTAGQAAQTPLIMLRKEDNLCHAAELMRRHNTTHVVVVTSRGEYPLGVVSSLDIARALAVS